MNHRLDGFKIALLFTEQARFDRSRRPMIEHLSALWKEMGANVVVIRGVGKFETGVDLLIPHIDLTVTPEKYVDYISRYPRVVNRKLTDNSKLKVSSNLVMPDSKYPGPVIIKTNQNYGGFPELRRGPGRVYSAMRPGGMLRPWHRVRAMLPAHYQVMDHVKDVPEGVWTNDRLVVEKFLPERDGDFYCHHVSVVLGDVVMSRRLYSDEPIIKENNIVSAEAVEAPDELTAVREKFGLDFGKLDYVLHGGRMQVLDVNNTPGSPPMVGKNLDHLRPFAAGVSTLLP